MNKKRLLIVGLVGLVLLAGAGAYSLFPGIGFPGVGVDEAAVEDETDYVFVNVQPLSAPVIRHNRVSHFIYLEVALQVRDGVDVRAIRRQMPRLRDAFLQDLHSRSIMRGDDSRAIDFPALKARLVARGNSVLGAGIVHDVLIKKAMEAAG